MKTAIWTIGAGIALAMQDGVAIAAVGHIIVGVGLGLFLREIP